MRSSIYHVFVVVFLLSCYSGIGQQAYPIAQTGHITPIKSVCYSHDDNYIATLGDNNRIITWDIKKKLQGNSFYVDDSLELESIKFYNDKPYTLLALSNGRLYAVDLLEKAVKESYKPRSSDYSFLHYRVEGPQIKFGKSHSKNHKTIWPHSYYSKNPFNGYTCADYSEISDMIIAGDEAGKLYIFSYTDGKLIKIIESHYLTIRDVRFSHDGKTFSSVGDDRIIKVYSTADFKEIYAFKPLVNVVSQINFDSKSNKFVLSTSLGNIIEGDFSERSLKLKNVISKLYPATCVSYSGKSDYIVAGYENNSIAVYNRKNKEITDITLLNPFIISMVKLGNAFLDVFSDKKTILYSIPGSISNVAGQNTTIVTAIKNVRRMYNEISSYPIDLDKKSKVSYPSTGEIIGKNPDGFTKDGIVTYKENNVISIRVDTAETEDEKLIQFIGHTDKIIDWDFSLESNLMISCGSSGTLNFWNLSTGELLNTIFIIGEEDFVIFSPDNYYYSPTKSTDAISFSKEGELYPSAQFDIIYNRPDLILERFEFIDRSLIEGLERAYNKRLGRLGFSEDMFDDNFHLPDLIIKNKGALDLYSNEEIVSLELELSDSKYQLNRINIWMNDVPVFGVRGVDLSKFNSNQYTSKLPVKLSSGKNKIEVSCLNEKGVESLRETINVNYEPESKIKSDLYVIAISTSKYEQDIFNLKYAVKDGRDLVTYFQDAKGYGNIYIDTLFDEQVTVENVKKIKENLLGSDVEDEVILFVSGHGLLDQNFDFFLASYKMDFADPAKTGVSYELLNEILDSIPARKKLFMMDACHSGELDKENLIARNESADIEGTRSGVTSYSYRAGFFDEPERKNNAGLQNSFKLMQEYFSDLNKGSGTVIISAASGEGYAMESDIWQNGIFTYSFLEGLKNEKTDTDENGDITVSEIRDYVFRKVQFLTGGQQTPTSRQENLEFDFRIW